jgi:hypothetical protein
MKAKTSLLWIPLSLIASAGPAAARGQTATETDPVAAISNLENAAVKADLAGDAGFYRKVLAEDWTRGDSDGTWYSKGDVLKVMADARSFKTKREQLSALKVRVYGDAAVATYKDTYDIQFMGQRRVHSIIATDTFVRTAEGWVQVSSHGAETK